MITYPDTDPVPEGPVMASKAPTSTNTWLDATIELLEQLPDEFLKAGQVDVLHRGVLLAQLRAARDPQPVAIIDDEYAPPSIADGTVSEDLIRSLNRLVDEYGLAGVTSTLKEYTSGGMLGYMGVDAQRWAQEFVALNPTADEGNMIGWFANAIEAGRGAGQRDVQDRT